MNEWNECETKKLILELLIVKLKKFKIKIKIKIKEKEKKLKLKIEHVCDKKKTLEKNFELNKYAYNNS